MGDHTEKFLTLEEAARRLKLPADDIKAMIGAGKLSAFRIGGAHLRIRSADVDALERTLHSQAAAQPVLRKTPSAELRKPSARSFFGRILDFFYFNDFYIFCILVIVALLFVIYLL